MRAAAARAGQPPPGPHRRRLRAGLPSAHAGAGRPPCSASPAAGTRCWRSWKRACDFRVAGRTLDDAAGEAFDKGARLLGLRYPGGAELDRLAAQGDPATCVSRAPCRAVCDFSFSGLKTALLYYLREQTEADVLARSGPTSPPAIRARIVRQLVDKTVRCAEAESLRPVAMAGGVAANSGLRDGACAASASGGACERTCRRSPSARTTPP